MRLRHKAGIWELFIPQTAAGARYKYEILSTNGDLLPARADPVAFQSELAPATASRPVGVPGAVRGVAATVEEAALVPTEFTALTRKE